MKTVLLIPGFKEDLKSRDYKSVINAIESRGYKVAFVPIQWKRTTITNWLNDLDEIYRAHDPAQTILAGFSFGAMTALVAATKSNPSELWLFSLSPYFAEDHQSRHMKQIWLNGFGKHRTEDFAKLNFKSLAKLVRCKTLVFVGGKEIIKYEVMNERFKDSIKRLPNNQAFVVDSVGHNVAHRDYVKTILGSV